MESKTTHPRDPVDYNRSSNVVVVDGDQEGVVVDGLQQEVFVMCAVNGDLEGLRVMAQQARGVSVNGKNQAGWTALMASCWFRTVNTALHLADRPDVDLNVRHADDGSASIHHAAFADCATIVRHLLTKPNLEVNARDSNGRTALHIACREGYTEVIQQLVQHRRVDLNVQDNDGRTPLSQALARNTVDVVELLLSQPNIGLNVQDSVGSTALHEACYFGLIRIVKLILDHPRVNLYIKDCYGQTPEDLISIEEIDGYFEQAKNQHLCRHLEVVLRGLPVCEKESSKDDAPREHNAELIELVGKTSKILVQWLETKQMERAP